MESIFYSRLSEDSIISYFKNNRNLINEQYAGKTPLAMCIFQNYLKVFNFLLEHGSTIHFITIIKDKPANLVDLAIYKDRPEMLEILYNQLRAINIEHIIKSRIDDFYFLQKKTIELILKNEKLRPFYITWSQLEVPFSWYVRNVGFQLKDNLLGVGEMTFLDFSVFYLFKEDQELLRENSNFNIGDYVSNKYLEKLYKNRNVVELHKTKGNLEIPLIENLVQIIESYLRPKIKSRYKVLI